MFESKKELKQELQYLINKITILNPQFKLTEYIDLSKKELKDLLFFLQEQIKIEKRKVQEYYDLILKKIDNPNKRSFISSFGYCIGLPNEPEKANTHIICIKYSSSDDWIEIYNSKKQKLIFDDSILYEEINGDVTDYLSFVDFDTYKCYKTLTEEEIEIILSFINIDISAIKLFIKYINQHLLSIESDVQKK